MNLNRFLSWLIRKPARFFGLALVLFTSIVLILDISLNFRTYDDWKGVLIEAHGMLLDILVFGILVSVYEEVRRKTEKYRQAAQEKEEKIARYQEEIDDFRGWDGEEAKFRILGNIKRLNKLEIYQLKLDKCFLAESSIQNISLVGSSLWGTKFMSSLFNQIDFSCIAAIGVNFAESTFGIYSNFRNENVSDEEWDFQSEQASVKFQNANLSHSFFYRSRHKNTHFENATLTGSNFIEATLIEVRFENAILCQVIGGEEYKAAFEGAHFLGCTASQSQIEDFIKCGAEFSYENGIKFI